MRGRADSKNTSSMLSWQALSQMMQNLSGQEIDYDSFKSEFDTNPAFKELIDRFDANGVVLKTKTKLDQTGQRADKAKAQANVNSSAKRAAAKELNK